MKPRRLVTDALLALALLAYPRAFRDRFGREMRADFYALATHAPATTLGHALAAHVGSGLAERVAAMRRWPLWPNRQPHLYEPRGDAPCSGRTCGPTSVMRWRSPAGGPW